MSWRKTRAAREQLKYERAAADLRGHDAVRAAEDFVSSSWIGQLLDSEQRVAQAIRACAHLREEREAALHAAQSAGDPRRIVVAQVELELAVHDLAGGEGAYAHIERLIAQELDCWGAARARRVAEARSDRVRMDKAADALKRAARIGAGAATGTGREARNESRRRRFGISGA